MFRRNRHLVDELRDTPEMNRTLKSVANRTAAAARAAAPDGGPHIGVRERIRAVQDDQGTRVEIFDVAGASIEFGSKNNPTYAPLRRGASAAGLHLREAPRA
jgi:hypothetical protein